MKKVAVVLFSDDFRIKDNPAFYNANLSDYKIIPLFIYNSNYLGREIGEASKVFLHFILKNFSNLLFLKYGQKLIIKNGDVIAIIKDIQKEIPFETIFFNHSYTEFQIKVENEIKNNFSCKSFKAKLIFEPTQIRELKVFTPFWKECLKNIHDVGEVLPEPSSVDMQNCSSILLEDLNLLPKLNWWKDMHSFWNFDYQKINSDYELFFQNKIENYKETRNSLDLDGVSKFSPYIRFGVFSVRDLFLRSLNRSPAFNSEIGWREFAFHTLFKNQNLSSKEVKSEFSNFLWDNNKNFLLKWQKGETGEDIVDAGMKELWKTGFMHGRARMICASFVIKDLLIDWKIGEKWFWDCLIDACPAVNPFSWQWVFGSGYDSAPYFRIFNPKLQKEKFDPSGTYVKKWNTKPKLIGIVNHDVCKKEALLRYKNLKEPNLF